MQIKLNRSEIEDAVTRWVQLSLRVGEGEELEVSEITVQTGGQHITAEVDTVISIPAEEDTGVEVTD